MISQKGQYLHLLLPPLDVVISEPEFIMRGPFQHGKEIFSCDEHLSLYLGVSLLLKDYYCSLIPQLTTVPVRQWNKDRVLDQWASMAADRCFPKHSIGLWEWTASWGSERYFNPIATSQWGILQFASAASKEIMFSLWDHINCSSSNGSFLLLRKCAGSGTLCQGYGRKLCWR